MRIERIVGDKSSTWSVISALIDRLKWDLRCMSWMMFPAGS